MIILCSHDSIYDKKLITFYHNVYVITNPTKLSFEFNYPINNMIASTYFEECNELFPCHIQPSDLDELKLEHDEWNSLYIPVIPNNLCLSGPNGERHRFKPKHLSYFIEKNMCIGKVRRIDFIDRNIDSDPVPVKAALVHFDYWYDNDISRKLRETLKSERIYRSDGYHCQSEYGPTPYHCGFTMTNRRAYIDFKINHKPVEDRGDERNPQQLHAENRTLEATIVSKNNRIAELERELEDMKSKMMALSICYPDDDKYVSEMDTTIYPVPLIRSNTTVLTMEDLEC